MFTNNCFGAFLSILLYVYSVVVDGDDTHIRVMNDQKMFMNLMTIGLSGCLGQVFVFFTVSLFDCYFLTIITTTRKFFSVVYSNYIFGHNFTNIQWFGASIVMLCTALELTTDKKGKKDKEKEKDAKKEN